MVPAIRPSALQSLRGIIHLSGYYLEIGIDTLECEYSTASPTGSWICFFRVGTISHEFTDHIYISFLLPYNKSPEL